MFFACKPYREYSLFCGNRILLLNTTDFSMKFIDLNEFTTNMYENECTGIITYNDSVVMLYDADNKAYFSEVALECEWSVLDQLRDSRISCKNIGGVTQDLFDWYLNGIHVRIVYCYSNKTITEFYVNDTRIKYEGTAFGFNYAFMFRDMLILRFTATVDFSIALDKDSNILSVWTAEGNCLLGDMSIATKVDMLSVY